MALFSNKPDQSQDEPRTLVVPAPTPEPIQPLGVSGSSPPAVPVPAAEAALVDRDAALKALERKIASGKRRLVDGVLSLGESLTEARALFADGDSKVFLHWARKRCGLTPRTAQRYMAAWRCFGRCDTVSQRRFDVTALHVLAAPTVPMEAVQEAVDIAEDGGKITPAVARLIVKRHAPAEAPKAKAGKPGPNVYQDVQGVVSVRLADAGADPLHILTRVVRQLMEDRKAEKAAA